MSDLDNAALKRQHLRTAIQDLRERGLNAAARWAAEQLAGLPAQMLAQSQPQPMPAANSDLYLLALSLFEAKVYNPTGRVHELSRVTISATQLLTEPLGTGIPSGSSHTGCRSRQQSSVSAMLLDLSGRRKAQAVRAWRSVCLVVARFPDPVVSGSVELSKCCILAERSG